MSPGSSETLKNVAAKVTEVEKDFGGEEIVDNPQELPGAAGRAQMDGKDHLYISEKLFNYLSSGKPTPFITYGSPGIRLYKPGTKEECEKSDFTSPEAMLQEKGK